MSVTSAPASPAPLTAILMSFLLNEPDRVLPANARVFGVLAIVEPQHRRAETGCHDETRQSHDSMTCSCAGSTSGASSSTMLAEMTFGDRRLALASVPGELT